MKKTKRVAVGLLAAGVMLGGCGGSRTETVAVDSTLVDVLVELHLLAARQAVVGDVTPALRDSVLAHYGQDSVAVVRWLQRYAHDPEAFRQLYQQIQERLMQEHYGREATPR